MIIPARWFAGGRVGELSNFRDEMLKVKATLEQSKAKYKFVFAHHVMGTNRGGIDVSPVILILLILLHENIIVRYVYPNVF